MCGKSAGTIYTSLNAVVEKWTTLIMQVASTLGLNRCLQCVECSAINELFDSELAKSRNLSSWESRCFMTVFIVCEEAFFFHTRCTFNEPSWLLPLHAYALVDEGFQFHWL